MQSRRPVLFTYVVLHDTGAAPNPFWGTCTLVICKPRIRRAAQVGDWVVGTGSAQSPAGDLRGHIVFAMEITDKMTMQDYDTWTQRCLSEKVPDWSSPDPRRRLGDSVYDFSSDPPAVRQSVHGVRHRERDLSGGFALLSRHFWYFGDQAERLPEHLEPIVKRGPGHRSGSNAPYMETLLTWLEGRGHTGIGLHGWPLEKLFDEERQPAGEDGPKVALPAEGRPAPANCICS